jgi:hypothetical protein
MMPRAERRAKRMDGSYTEPTMQTRSRLKRDRGLLRVALVFWGTHPDNRFPGPPQLWDPARRHQNR